MPRPLRSLYPPGPYHVYSRGVDGCAIFRDRADRLQFLRFLALANRAYRWRCWAFCLMTTHYHLVLDVRQPFLSAGMQWLNGVYATAFNAAHARSGHLFGGRFGAVAIDSDEQLSTTCAYVVANPVRARITATVGEYPWARTRA